MSTGRLEAFSDGVIAVAITLLVLNIQVPSLADAQKYGLAGALGRNWAMYAAYVTSFLTIGIIWINHHVMIGRLREADRTIMFLNLLLLLSIGVLPFATSLLAQYLQQSNGQHLAAAVYGGSFLVMAVFFTALNRHILLVKHDKLKRSIPAEDRRRIFARSVIGVIPYAIATALAAVSSYVTLAICFVLAAYYAFPIGSGEPRAS